MDYATTYYKSLEVQDAQGWGSAVADFGRYGITASLASGAMGLANTGVAFANMFGADLKETTTTEFLDNLGMKATAQYARQNETLTEFGGLIAGSIVPGVIGIKALKMAQRGLEGAGEGSRVISGIRATLVPRKQVDAMIDAARTKGTVASSNLQLTTKAAKQGFHQQMLEAAFAETAILLTMNQHSMLNDDDLDYLDSVKDNFDSLVLGTLLGGGIGGAAATVGIKNQMQLTIKDMYKQIRQVADSAVAESNVAILPGDALSAVVTELGKARKALNANPANALEKKELVETAAYLERSVGELIKTTIRKSALSADPEYAGHISTKLTQQALSMDPAHAVNSFAGLNRIKAVTEDYGIFEPKAEAYGVYDNIDDLTKHIQQLDPAVADPKIAREMAIQKWQDTYGFAYTGRHNAEIKVAVLNGNTDATLDQQMATLRHEIGHVTGRHLARVLDTKVGTKARKEMVEVSRLARPAAWARADRNQLLIDEIDDALKKIDDFDSEDYYRLVNRRLQLKQHIDYMNNPDELVADNLGMFTSPDYERLATQFPRLQKLFAGNNLLRARARETEVFLDLETSNLSKQVDRVPTIADLGRWEIKGKQVVLHSVKGDTRTFNADAPLDPFKDAPDVASAKYLWAKQNPLTEKDLGVQIGTADFVGMQRVLDAISPTNAKGFKGKVVVEDISAKTGVRSERREFDFSTEPERAAILFRKYVTQRKVDTIHEMTKGKAQGTFSLTDIARVVDTDVEFAQYSKLVNSVVPEQTQQSGLAFWSETYDPRKPTQVKLGYSRDLQAPTTETEVKSMVEVKKRIDEAEIAAVHSIQGYMAETLRGKPLMMPDPAVVSGRNRFRDATQADETQGFFRAQNADYADDVEQANAIGRGVGMWDNYADRRISELTEAAAHAVIRNPDAMAELSVSISKFRQHKMEEIPAAWKVAVAPQAGGPVRNWFSTIARSNLNLDSPSDLMRLQQKMQLLEPMFVTLQAHVDKASPLKAISSEMLGKLEKVALAPGIDRDAIEDLKTIVNHQLADVQHPAVANFWRAMREANQDTVTGAKLSASLKGKSAGWNAEQFYPGAIDRQLYKDIVFVRPKNPGLMMDKEFGIIGGPNAQVVEDKLALLRSKYGDEFETITQKNNDATHKQLLQDWEEGLAVDSFYFDSSKMNMGKAADLMPDPNPQLVWSMLESYKRQGRTVRRNLVRQMYNREFATMESYETIRSGQIGAFGTKDKEASVFQDRMATMLNMPNDNRFQGWRQAQRSVDKLFSDIWNTVVTLPLRATTPNMMDVPTGNYQKMNALAERYGLPQMYNSDLQDYLVTSLKVNDQILASLVPRMNWIGATLTLRLDLIQPVINAISLPILANPEIKHLMDALPELRRSQVTESLTVKAIDNKGVELAREMSNGKLWSQATVNWFKRKDLLERYKALGIVGERAEFYQQAVDASAQVSKRLVDNPEDWKDSVSTALGKTTDWLAKFGDSTEDYVRFVAADMARQVLDTAGITGKTADLAIQSYVNRVTGNYQYAQRPGMFQGFAGQAIGLFQTYQFNLIQQLLRHLGDKPSRAAAMMGLQTGIFGLQSTPGFELLNNHVAERSNYEGDFYTGINEMVGDTKVFGSTAADWILYGMASNFVRPVAGDGIDLFSRGNLNPRSPILIPSSLEEVPLVSMSTKLMASRGQAANNLAGGVPVWDTFSQALATNGINRPLQGIGQLMAGERITSQGSTLLSTADLSWWQRIARVAGARGMDEAVAVGHYYRAVKYESARQDKLNELGRVVKAQVNAGNWNGDSYSDLMQQYAAEGGNIDRYNKWAQGMYQSATQSQISELYNRNDSVEGRYMQQLMGGGVEQYINPWNLPEQ